jgi:hypothetical protein
MCVVADPSVEIRLPLAKRQNTTDFFHYEDWARYASTKTDSVQPARVGLASEASS